MSKTMLSRIVVSVLVLVVFAAVVLMYETCSGPSAEYAAKQVADASVSTDMAQHSVAASFILMLMGISALAAIVLALILPPDKIDSLVASVKKLFKGESDNAGE